MEPRHPPPQQQLVAQYTHTLSGLAAVRLIHVMRDHRNVKINLGLWLLRERCVRARAVKYIRIKSCYVALAAAMYHSLPPGIIYAALLLQRLSLSQFDISPRRALSPADNSPINSSSARRTQRITTL